MLARFYSTGIILLLTIATAHAAGIEGIWQVDNSNDFIEIRSTNDGIKAKFVNQGNWDFYEHLRRNTYEDRRGNRYTYRSDEDLVWESRDNRKVIRLRKSYNDRYGRNNDRYRDDDWRDDRYDRNDRYDRDGRYIDRNHRGDWNNGRGNVEVHVCGPNCGPNCNMVNTRRGDRYLSNQLSGTWTNRFRNRIAYVDYDGFVLRMKTNRSRGWTTYRRTHHRKLEFEDRFGNTIRFRNNGEMRWRRADRGRTIDFIKDYR